MTYWAGSVPGVSGSACSGQQAVAAALLAGGNAAVPLSAVQQAVCNPLAALTLPQAGDTQAACNAGALDQVLDGIIFNGASQMNMTWTQQCLATIPFLFQPALATNLINCELLHVTVTRTHQLREPLSARLSAFLLVVDWRRTRRKRSLFQRSVGCSHTRHRSALLLPPHGLTDEREPVLTASQAPPPLSEYERDM